MNVAKIRGFLLQHPKPNLVRLHGDGEPQDLKPGKSYAKTAESIAAIAPDLIEALDAGGKLLRAMRTTDAEFEQRVDVPVPQLLAMDSNAAMLTHFANLLAGAYKHSTDVAFTKLVEVVERIGDRAEAIESRLERQEALNRRQQQQYVDDALAAAEELAEKAREEAEAAGGKDELLSNLAGAFLGGMGGKAQAAPKPPAKTNGAAPKGPS